MTSSGPSKKPEPLAHRRQCRYCEADIVLAVCFDGRWRVFDPQTQPPAPRGTWAFHRVRGMTETDKAPGHTRHVCMNNEAELDVLRLLSEARHPPAR